MCKSLHTGGALPRALAAPAAETPCDSCGGGLGFHGRPDAQSRARSGALSSHSTTFQSSCAAQPSGQQQHFSGRSSTQTIAPTCAAAAARAQPRAGARRVQHGAIRW